MTDPLPAAEAVAADGALPKNAGILLKAARERAGLHLAVLAATIKVSPAKLQALEQGHYDQLPNATFTRALAQSVCRSLKIDPRPVLALLPQVDTLPLEGAAGRLNTPFHERPARSDGGGLAWASKPMFWAGGLLLLAAVLVAFVPPDLVEQWMVQAPALSAPAPSPVASGTSVVEVKTAADASPPAEASFPVSGAVGAGAIAAPTPVVDGAAAAAALSPPPMPAAAAGVEVATAAAPPALSPPAAAMPALPAASAVVGGGLLRLSASADSWIEVVDGQGQPVFSRILARGEAVALNPAPPLRVRVGNVAGTSVAFRGQAFDLGPYTRDNVARLELR